MTDSEETPVERKYAKTLEDVMAREAVIKREWIDKVKDTYEIYSGDKHDKTPFNILYSNTEILVPNIFSSAPKAVVRKRYGDMRADSASRAAERMADYCMDTNLSGYPDFTDAISSVVLDAALPGQGQARVRLVDNTAVIDYIQHDQFIWGFCKRWEDCPWVAYRSDMTREDAISKFGVSSEMAAKVEKEPESSATSDKGPATLAIYEVWNKATREVFFLCDSFPDKMIKVVADPLQLNGFFPSAKPLRLLFTPNSTMPKSLYGLYKKQAEELNLVTRRIKKITEAVRVRGLYDGTIPEMAQLFGSDGDENMLIAASSPGNMLREGGLEKHIWLVPFEKLVVVLQTLHQVRDQIKATIYEILGIGDILRGVSAASETASAQQIKDKWGSLRIKKSREAVSIFVREQIRFIIEVSAKHVDEENWAKVTGLPFVSAMQALIAQQTPGAPSQESWGAVLGTLRDDMTRSYVIDIESNSTVDADATEDKAEVAEFMGALAQAMQGLEALGSVGPEGFEASKILLIEICKRYRMGNEVQGVLSRLAAPPKGPTEEQTAAKEALDKQQQEVEKAVEGLKSQEEALKAQMEQNKQQVEQARTQLTGQKDSITAAMQSLEKQAHELEKQRAEIELAIEKLDLKKQALELLADKKVTEIQAKVNEASNQHSEREVALSKSAVDFESKKAKETADSAEKTLGQADAISKLMEGIGEQSKLVKDLIDSHARPVIIKKTGPGTFERKLG